MNKLNTDSLLSGAIGASSGLSSFHLANGVVAEVNPDNFSTQKNGSDDDKTEAALSVSKEPSKDDFSLPQVDNKDDSIDGSDPYSYLDWKDGIATLPGIRR